MILRISTIITTQARTFAIKQTGLQTKRLKPVAVKQPARKKKIDYNAQKNMIKSLEEYQGDPEGFGDFESDFMSAHKSHKQFENETEEYREKMQSWIVRRKYFNEKQPNFLTYAEKQQMKMLHAKDPEEWTTERLSESFPADPITIAKIIKAKWSAISAERIMKHDEHVINNWSMFKEGKLMVPDHLKEHLQKFAVRTLEDLKNNKIETPVRPSLPVPRSTEFSNIITSCKGLRNEQKLIESPEGIKVSGDRNTSPSASCGPEDETFLMGKIVDRRKMRLQDFKGEIIAARKEKSEELQLQNPNGTGIIPPKVDNESTELVVSQEDMKKFEISTIKERIHIPRKLWQRGATYKVDDCYYDFDGEFLYRVPGMTGTK